MTLPDLTSDSMEQNSLRPSMKLRVPSRGSIIHINLSLFRMSAIVGSLA